MSNPADMKSSYLKLLPSIFSGAEEDTATFFERFLKIFEKLLTGIDDGSNLPPNLNFNSLAEIIDSVSDNFYPKDTLPEEFVDWLASWVGLVLKEDWSITRKKEIIKEIIPLYRLRGTKRGLEELVRIYIGSGVEIKEMIGSFPVGYSSVGVDTIIGRPMKPYSFIVNVQLAEVDLKKRKLRKKNIRNLLDLEKPIHTNYFLDITIPTIQVGVKKGCVIGENTLLGGTKTENKW